MTLSLVTGATGFVGSAVALRLAAAGHELRLLVRAGSNRANLAGLDAELVTGDLDDPASLARAVAGCDAVFHVAADYRLWVPRPEAMYRTNVDGSVALVRAAAEAGAGRIVYCSSVASIACRADGVAADETTPTTADDMISHYKRSKFLAEEKVMALAREGAPIVAVNPSAPLGPRDIRPTPTGRLVVEAASGRIPAYVETGLNIVHVDDVAEGHLLAFARGTVGERYILGGENMTLRELIVAVARAAGREMTPRRLPRRPLYPLAWIMEGWGRITGAEPLMTSESLKMAAKRMFYSSDKAKAALGYAPRPAADAIADAVAWFRAHGYLR